MLTARPRANYFCDPMPSFYACANPIIHVCRLSRAAAAGPIMATTSVKMIHLRPEGKVSASARQADLEQVRPIL